MNNTSTGETSDVIEAAPEAKRPRLEETAEQTREDMASNLPNPHLDKLDSDFLYHIGYSREDCVEEFKDVKVTERLIYNVVVTNTHTGVQ